MRLIPCVLVTLAAGWSAARGQFVPQGGKLIGSRSLGIANQFRDPLILESQTLCVHDPRGEGRRSGRRPDERRSSQPDVRRNEHFERGVHLRTDGR